MARSLLLIPFFAAVLLGCQRKEVGISNLPRPNFAPPVVSAAPAPAPSPPPQPAAAPGAAEASAARAPIVPQQWIPSAPPNTWQWIVIHHSATPAGSAPIFDREHRRKGWDELGYHFVIGNGTASADGQIEVGSRWPKQKWGAHAKTADGRFNNFGIGICLVGNFEIDRPTPAQLRSLARLTAYLSRTYGIPSTHIIGHGQAKPTDCPGRNMSIAQVRRQADQWAIEHGIRQESPTRLAAGELLQPTGR